MFGSCPSELDDEMLPLVLWILATVATCFIESLDILNTIFLSSLISNPLDPVDFIFFYISSLKSLNLVLIPGAKLDDHQGTWVEYQKS